MSTAYGPWPIFGHEHQVEILQRAAEAGTLSHAYLIYGLRGLGKKYLVSCLVKQLLCQTGKNSCQECQSCQLLANRRHPDVRYLPLYQASSIGVDDVRQVLNFVTRSTQMLHGYKVVIIERAEYLTPEAANALLKTLEEAPPKVIFFLLAQNVTGVQPTIRSRCALLKLLPLPESEMRRWLQQFNLEASVEETVLRLAMGRPGRALDLLSDGLASYRLALTRGLAIIKGSAVNNFAYIKTWLDETQKQARQGNALGLAEASLEEIDYLELAIRDLLLMKVNSGFVVNAFITETLRPLAASLAVGTLLKIMAALRQLRYNIHQNLNVALSWEYFFLQISELKQIV